MLRISRRDFLLHTNKYIKASQFVITNHGKDQYIVTIAPSEAMNVATLEKPGPLSNKPDLLSADTDPLKHGCGCVHGDSYICKKHQRY